MTVILETPRLRLREMGWDDLPFITALLGDPQVTRFYPHQYGPDEARAWVARQLDRYRRDGHGQWLVLDRGTDEPVGQVGLSLQLIEGVWEPEIGYMICSRLWGRGLAPEAACAVRDLAFTRFHKPHVISLIRPINRPSHAVARKVGLRPVRLTLHGGLEHLVFRLDRG